MKIGETLQKHRKDHHLTQEQLARMLNMSRQTISKWENDRGFPDIENLIWLCDIYKISLDDLVGRKQVSYTVKAIRKRNKRKDLIQMFPKYTGIIVSVLGIILVVMLGMGTYSMKQEKVNLQEEGLMIVYSVIDDPIDEKTGKYQYFELENGEKIEASMRNIDKYELANSVNQITPYLFEKSSIYRHINLSRLTDS